MIFFCSECVGEMIPERHLCKYNLSLLFCCTFQLLVPRYMRVICSEGVTCFTTCCFHATASPRRDSGGIWGWSRRWACSDHRPCGERSKRSAGVLFTAVRECDGAPAQRCACLLSSGFSTVTRLRLDPDALLHLCCMWLSSEHKPLESAENTPTHVKKYRLSSKIQSSCTCGSGS